MMTIYLLGVYHKFQTEMHSEFLDYLRTTCANYNIRSLAEEMNIDALKRTKAKKSSVLVVAEEIGSPHFYCDPDLKERQDKNILGEAELYRAKWFNNW